MKAEIAEFLRRKGDDVRMLLLAHQADPDAVDDRGHDRVVLQSVRPGICVAGIVGGDAVLAEIDAQIAIGVDRVALDVDARRRKARERDAVVRVRGDDVGQAARPADRRVRGRGDQDPRRVSDDRVIGDDGARGARGDLHPLVVALDEVAGHGHVDGSAGVDRHSIRDDSRAEAVDAEPVAFDDGACGAGIRDLDTEGVAGDEVPFSGIRTADHGTRGAVDLNSAVVTERRQAGHVQPDHVSEDAIAGGAGTADRNARHVRDRAGGIAGDEVALAGVDPSDQVVGARDVDAPVRIRHGGGPGRIGPDPIALHGVLVAVDPTDEDARHIAGDDVRTRDRADHVLRPGDDDARCVAEVGRSVLPHTEVVVQHLVAGGARAADGNAGTIAGDDISRCRNRRADDVVRGAVDEDAGAVCRHGVTAGIGPDEARLDRVAPDRRQHDRRAIREPVDDEAADRRSAGGDGKTICQPGTRPVDDHNRRTGGPPGLRGAVDDQWVRDARQGRCRRDGLHAARGDIEVDLVRRSAVHREVRGQDRLSQAAVGAVAEAVVHVVGGVDDEVVAAMACRCQAIRVGLDEAGEGDAAR